MATHKQFLHRLYTEDINRQVVTDILTKHFDAFTIFEAKGVWQGIPEHSLCIEVLGASYATVMAVARAIKEANKQQAVLHIVSDVKSQLI